jgi:hypothetical protein
LRLACVTPAKLKIAHQRRYRWVAALFFMSSVGGRNMTTDAQAVLAFWFQELSPAQWFKKDAQIDQQIIDRFGPTRIAMRS